MVKIEVIFDKKNKEVYLNPKKWKDIMFFIMISDKSEEMCIRLFLMKNLMDAIKHEDKDTLSINLSRLNVFRSNNSVHQNNLEEFLYIIVNMDANAKKFLQNTDIQKLICEMKEFFKEMQDYENLQNILNKIEGVET
jgi:hypothetical protein